MTRSRPSLLALSLLLPLLATRLDAQGGTPATSVAARDGAPPAADDSLVLESHLWRNFQPTTGTPDTALTALLRVSAASRRPMPAGMRLERAELTSGARRWAVTLDPAKATHEGEAMELLVRGGPPWPIGATVDVTVLLRDARGRTQQLRSRAQPIRRLD